jgi:hypothetical protein
MKSKRKSEREIWYKISCTVQGTICVKHVQKVCPCISSDNYITQRFTSCTRASGTKASVYSNRRAIAEEINVGLITAETRTESRW